MFSKIAASGALAAALVIAAPTESSAQDHRYGHHQHYQHHESHAPRVQLHIDHGHRYRNDHYAGQRSYQDYRHDRVPQAYIGNGKHHHHDDDDDDDDE